MRISAITLMDLPAHHVLSIRRKIDFMADFDRWSGESFDAVQRRLEALRAHPAAAPFVCFHNDDLSNLDVEAGFATAALLDGEGTIRGRTIDATTAAVAIHQGPYAESDPMMEEVLSWVVSQGRELAGPIYHHYLNDPSFPSEKLLLQMTFPVK